MMYTLAESPPGSVAVAVSLVVPTALPPMTTEGLRWLSTHTSAHATVVSSTSTVYVRSSTSSSGSSKRVAASHGRVPPLAPNSTVIPTGTPARTRGGRLMSTVTEAVAVNLEITAVSVPDPLPTAVTTPLEFTVNTLASVDVQATVPLKAAPNWSVTFAVNEAVSPTEVRVTEPGEIDMAAARGASGGPAGGTTGSGSSPPHPASATSAPMADTRRKRCASLPGAALRLFIPVSSGA